MKHILKLNMEFADAVLSGDKSFEIRYNDRGYQKGDLIQFQVNDGPFELNHPLNKETFEITYIISGWGLKENWVALSIKKLTEVKQ